MRCHVKKAISQKNCFFQVYGSVFITTIVFSPIFGKFINSIGSRNLFLYGTFLAGSSNVLFGFLQYVNGSSEFFYLSLAVRIVSAIGESAFFCAIYPLATAVSIKKTTFWIKNCLPMFTSKIQLIFLSNLEVFTLLNVCGDNPALLEFFLLLHHLVCLYKSSKNSKKSFP